MKKKFDICGIGNGLLDKQYKVPLSFINEIGYTIDQMTLVDQDEQLRIISLLEKHQYQSISACGGSATNSLVAAS
ncbi:adenosine kinase, partial [Candidatus Marinamargulisbacteria bacterium SCGC AG-343-D04]